MPELLSGTRQHGGMVRKDGAALQYMMLMRLLSGITGGKRARHSGCERNGKVIRGNSN